MAVGCFACFYVCFGAVWECRVGFAAVWGVSWARGVESDEDAEVGLSDGDWSVGGVEWVVVVGACSEYGSEAGEESGEEGVRCNVGVW